jgi:flavin-dependent dehydrogenase
MQEYDVIIAGGGPAGCTAATLLCQYGYKVLILERGQHPRFHIGESMMPQIEPIMNRLGIDWGQGNLRKSGADFIHEPSGKSLYFPLQGQYQTFQIERSEFDHKMFNHALAEDAEGHQNEKVTAVVCDEEAVHVTSSSGSYKGRYFIDATGRSALMGRKFASVNRIKNLGKLALYQHYQLVDNPEVEELFAMGNVKILLVDIGWLWVIPLIGKRLSIGLVVQNQAKTELVRDELFEHYVNSSPLLTQFLKDSTTLSPIQAEADFSYTNNRRYGARYACCGDAAGFLDPVFSSGFFFALKTAEMIADRLHQGFVNGQEAAPELHSVDDLVYKTGFNTMHLLIDRFYRSNLVENLIYEFDRHARIKEELTALLAGDLWSEGNLFQQGLLKGRRSAIFSDGEDNA